MGSLLISAARFLWVRRKKHHDPSGGGKNEFEVRTEKKHEKATPAASATACRNPALEDRRGRERKAKRKK